MCLILFAVNAHPDYPLVIAANRDEFYARPTQPLAPWADAPQLLAGRDLEAGGTWLGLTREGRFAAITNVHGDAALHGRKRSRGELTRDFLLGAGSAAAYAQRAAEDGGYYTGFNLLVGDSSGLFYCSNRNHGDPRRLDGGIYGLANESLDTPWPKVESGKAELQQLLEGEPQPQALLALLADHAPAPADASLEVIGLSREEILTSRFLSSERYGTRASTVLLIDCAGLATVWEQNFSSGGRAGELRRFDWQLDAIPR